MVGDEKAVEDGGRLGGGGWPEPRKASDELREEDVREADLLDDRVVEEALPGD